MDLFAIIMINIIIIFLLLVSVSFNNAHDDNQYNKIISNTIKKYPFEENAAASIPIPISVSAEDDEYNKYNSIKKNKTLSKDIQKETQNNHVIGKTNNILNTFSVVQDWHLVCAQLCGAGLGGPTCGEPTCEKIKNEASQKYNISEKANRLLEENADPICQDLCEYQLGGDICSCEKRLFLVNFELQVENGEGPLWGRNQICHTFCEYNDLTITGCSICSKHHEDDDKNKNNSTKKSVSYSNNIKATTPNWEKICQELCKSGDGGSLCNCDKPPFF